eukprot:217737-Ditylum_brightwellii.AAC.1
MSANKCPFSFNSSFLDDTHRKHLYTSFDIHLDPANTNSITVLHSIQKLDSNDAKHNLMFIQSFDDIIKKATIPERGQCWTLFEPLLLGLPETKWTNCTAAVVLCNQGNFEAMIKLLRTDFMTIDVSEDILKWLCNLYKPKDMMVNNFAAQLDHFNKLVCY